MVGGGGGGATNLPAYVNAAPTVWADAPDQRQIARGQPEDDGSLRFTFAKGDPVYRALVSTPGLSAIVVVDRANRRIMSVKFHGRRS